MPRSRSARKRAPGADPLAAPVCPGRAGLSGEHLAAFHGPLLDWYRASRRDLPWRRRENDPYAVWVSEIMLQQTQAATVAPYFERWMARFPTLEALASAPLEEVLTLWAGLGYYARARNLHAAARRVASEHAGRIPSGRELELLPGIGRYTAGAIRSIAFQLPAPILDANVIRVLARVFAVDGDPSSGPVRERLWDLAGALVPTGEARDFNQALMELGAVVCTPGDPACRRCPLVSVCIAASSPVATAWPQTRPGRPTARVVHASAMLRRGREWLVVQRPPHGLWAGLWEFPRRVCAPGEDPASCARRAAREVAGAEAGPLTGLVRVRHSVTHHAITLHGCAGDFSGGEPAALDCAAVLWASPEELASLPMAAPQRRLAQAAASPPCQQSLPLNPA